MAKFNGFNGIVKDATGGGTAAILGGVQTWSCDDEVTITEKWGMGDQWAYNVPTTRRASGSLEMEWDGADPHHSIAAGDAIDIELYPDGEATGATYISGNVIVESVSRSVNKDGTATLSLSWKSNGPLQIQTV